MIRIECSPSETHASGPATLLHDPPAQALVSIVRSSFDTKPQPHDTLYDKVPTLVSQLFDIRRLAANKKQGG
jgi:hypothetical protein